MSSFPSGEDLSFGLSLLHALAQVGRWRMASSFAVTVRGRLAWTLFSSRARRSAAVAKGTNGLLQFGLRHCLLSPACGSQLRCRTFFHRPRLWLTTAVVFRT